MTRFFISLCLLLILNSILFSKNETNSIDNCQYWISLVDPSVPSPDMKLDWKDESNVLNAIECLLHLKGKKGPAKFSGATNPYVSDIFNEATVEVAALYFITYLYYQKKDYVNAVVLIDKNGEYNTECAINKAYRLYKKWYKEIKKIGISNAQKKGLDPLKGSGIRWY